MGSLLTTGSLQGGNCWEIKGRALTEQLDFFQSIKAESASLEGRGAADSAVCAVHTGLGKAEGCEMVYYSRLAKCRNQSRLGDWASFVPAKLAIGSGNAGFSFLHVFDGYMGFGQLFSL